MRALNFCCGPIDRSSDRFGNTIFSTELHLTDRPDHVYTQALCAAHDVQLEGDGGGSRVTDRSTCAVLRMLRYRVQCELPSGEGLSANLIILN